MILTGLNLQVPSVLMTGMISTLTSPFTSPILLVLQPHLHNKTKMINGESNIKKQFQKCVPIIQNCNMTTILIFMTSPDHMAVFLPACSHPLAADIPTIAAVTPTMTGLKILAYLHTPPPQTDLTSTIATHSTWYCHSP